MVASGKSTLRTKFGILLLLGLVLIIGQVSIVHLNYDFTPSRTQTLAASKVSLRAEMARGRKTEKRSDGTFNTLDVEFIQKPLHSAIHCVGENYQEDAWIRRSCEFRNLCFDIEQKEFVLFRSPAETALQEALQNSTHPEHLHVSTSTMNNVSVAIGGLNPKWTWRQFGIPRLEWFPQVSDHELTSGYYQLPSDVVWIPFHSLAGFNPGHLIWDDLLATYTLLSMFQHLDKQHLLMRYVMDPGLWASCDYRDDRKEACQKMFTKFVPLMGIDPKTFSTTRDFSLVTKDKQPKSNYVCARHGLAGIGLLTDHGTKLHGWERKDYQTTHNHGRATMLYEFRNHVMKSMNMPVKPVNLKAPCKVTFSVNSSQRSNRKISFRQQMRALQNEFDTKEVIVQSFTMRDLSVEEQMRIASESAIFITVCGGGAVTATFLPKGASLILFFDEMGGRTHNKKTLFPARLDWDMWNNAGYVRAHWIPIRSMNLAADINAFVKLIKHELEIISSLA